MADEDGSIMRVVVFAATFVAIFALLISGVSGLWGVPDDPQTGLGDKRFSMGQFAEMDWWTAAADPGNMTSVGAVLIGTFWEAPSPGDVAISGAAVAVREGPGGFGRSDTTDAKGFLWEGSVPDLQGDHGIHMYGISNGTWIAYRETGGWDRYWDVITARDILDALHTDDSGVRSATVTVSVGITAQVTFYFPYHYDPARLLDQNLGYYEVGVGQYMSDKISTSSDLWGIAAQLLTFQLQATGVWWIDYLFSTIIWASIGYVAFVIVRSLVPFLG